MRVIYSDKHRLHHGKGEVIGGRFVPSVERPERLDSILAALEAWDEAELSPPEAFPPEALARVHDRAYLHFLEHAYAQWRQEHEGDALPYVWPGPGLKRVQPRSLEGRLGYYAFDASTPITAGTWEAALASAQVALTGSALVAGGERVALALCRPPGHHAGKDYYGGYCYLNNAAIAAQALVDKGARVALLDLDYHHGNGSQDIFYRRSDVLFVSLHADPADDFPYYRGYASETGAGAGEGYTLNLPLPLGTDWRGYSEALEQALRRIAAFSPGALVLSLGLDTALGDPISRFGLLKEDYLKLGARVAQLGLPTLLVLEGGYDVPALGDNLLGALKGFLQST